MASGVYTTLGVLRGSHRYNAWLYHCLKRYLGGTVLDVGSGLGDIARQFVHPAIDEVILSDYADEMLEALEDARFPLKKYRTLKLDISSPCVLTDHPPGIADTVTCINVLEHIADDIAALTHIRHLLKESGRAVVFVPALPFIHGTLDAHVEHHRRYTRNSLAAVFQEAGFRVQESYYMNMFGIVTWFLAGRVLKQKRFHRRACHVLDRMVPVLRALEHFGPPPVGQSLIMVGKPDDARRPAAGKK